MERIIEHRTIRDVNGFYRNQTRFLPLDSWECDDGWRTTYISEIKPEGCVVLDEKEGE